MMGFNMLYCGVGMNDVRRWEEDEVSVGAIGGEWEGVQVSD